jgi:hypothetical protein
MYKAMVEDGFIESETNTISPGEKAVVIHTNAGGI